jgi:hypothetical protein
MMAALLARALLQAKERNMRNTVIMIAVGTSAPTNSHNALIPSPK